MDQEPDASRRWLEDATVVQGRLVLTGWCFARRAGALRGMEVVAPSNRSFRVELVEIHESPDVARAFPEARCADRCRFRVALASQSGEIPEQSLTMLRPIFDHGFGRTWSIARGLESPPDELIEKIGGGKSIGVEFLDYFVDFGGLAPRDVVLDLGCGTGRMAIPLREFLDEEGRYIGIDVDPRLVEWCRENVEAHDGRFKFVHLPARNDMYNPGGSVDVKDKTLPIASDSVSFAFATSVLTHLRAADAAHYLRELGRVLRSKGRLLVTAFLIDRGPRDPAPSPAPDLDFHALDPETWTTDASLPEKAIGFAVESLNDWARAVGLLPVTRLPGTWARGRDGYTYQDVLVYQKA